jgi:hypothetical protein
VVRAHQSGQALLVALIILLLVSSAATMVAAHFGFRARLVSQESRRIHLVAMADAAIAESLARLQQSSGYRGVVQREFGGGTIASTITSLAGNRRQILASAHYRGWDRQVKVQVRLTTGALELEGWTSVPQHSH